MNAAMEKTIGDLAIAKLNRRMEFEMLGMCNSNVDYEEAKQLAVDYALAKARYIEACHALDVAMNNGQAVRP